MVFVLVIFLAVHLQTMGVLCSVATSSAAIWIIRRVTFLVALEHGHVDALVLANIALEWLETLMITRMIFEMVFVFGDKRARFASEHLL